MATMRRHPVGPRILRRLPEGWKPPRFQCFDVSPVTPTIGAELSGLSLDIVDDDFYAELDRVWQDRQRRSCFIGYVGESRTSGSLPASSLGKARSIPTAAISPSEPSIVECRWQAT